MWSASYGEGDGWHAHVCHDESVFLGGSDLAEVSDADSFQLGSNFDFGCMYELNGLFVTQLADGIMGMGMNDETPVPKLVAGRKLDKNEFALCFAFDGGTMTLGGAAEQ